MPCPQTAVKAPVERTSGEADAKALSLRERGVDMTGSNGLDVLQASACGLDNDAQGCRPSAALFQAEPRIHSLPGLCASALGECPANVLAYAATASHRCEMLNTGCQAACSSLQCMRLKFHPIGVSF